MGKFGKLWSVWVVVVTVTEAGAPGREARTAHRPYCYTNHATHYHMYSTKTSYTFARGNLTHDDMVPEGCEAQQVWQLVRHGTRYPSEDNIRDMLETLPLLQARTMQAVQDGSSKLCPGDVKLLEEWSAGSLNLSLSSLLAPQGHVELKEMGERFRAALPSLLHTRFTNQSFQFRHTATQRTEASARAYAEGVFGGPVYMPPPRDPDPLLKYPDMCSRYQREVEDNPEATAEYRLYLEGQQMRQALNRVSRRLGVPLHLEELLVIYNGCRFYQAWDPASPSPWCAALTPNVLKVVEDAEDLRKYYVIGYGHQINYRMACPTVHDLLLHFRNVVEGRTQQKGVFYFTHSDVVLSTVARLGLHRDSWPLTHISVPPHRRWHTSSLAPFAANLAFLLSSCGPNRWWVSMAVNEHAAALEGCSSRAGCSWDEFVSVYGRYVTCDLDEVCDNPSVGNSTTRPAPASDADWWWRWMRDLTSVAWRLSWLQ